MIIREATKEDVPKILPVWREMMEFHAVRDAHFAICESADQEFAKWISENIVKEDAIVYVAESTKSIVAYCLCLISERPPVCEMKRQYGNLSDLAVAEKYRRDGIGEQIVEQAMEWFRSQGLKRVEVRVAVTNEISTRFWRKMGFSTYLETMSKPVDLPEQT
ncbi:MAG: GNAT family N-acetyltransferase [Planctomycetota bacterium]